MMHCNKIIFTIFHMYTIPSQSIVELLKLSVLARPVLLQDLYDIIFDIKFHPRCGFLVKNSSTVRPTVFRVSSMESSFGA